MKVAQKGILVAFSTLFLVCLAIHAQTTKRINRPSLEYVLNNVISENVGATRPYFVNNSTQIVEYAPFETGIPPFSQFTRNEKLTLTMDGGRVNLKLSGFVVKKGMDSKFSVNQILKDAVAQHTLKLKTGMDLAINGYTTDDLTFETGIDFKSLTPGQKIKGLFQGSSVEVVVVDSSDSGAIFELSHSFTLQDMKEDSRLFPDKIMVYEKNGVTTGVMILYETQAYVPEEIWEGGAQRKQTGFRANCITVSAGNVETVTGETATISLTGDLNAEGNLCLSECTDGVTLRYVGEIASPTLLFRNLTITKANWQPGSEQPTISINAYQTVRGMGFTAVSGTPLQPGQFVAGEVSLGFEFCPETDQGKCKDNKWESVGKDRFVLRYAADVQRHQVHFSPMYSMIGTYTVSSEGVSAEKPLPDYFIGSNKNFFVGIRLNTENARFRVETLKKTIFWKLKGGKQREVEIVDDKFQVCTNDDDECGIFGKIGDAWKPENYGSKVLFMGFKEMNPFYREGTEVSSQFVFNVQVEVTYLDDNGEPLFSEPFSHTLSFSQVGKDVDQTE